MSSILLKVQGNYKQISKWEEPNAHPIKSAMMPF